MIEQKCYIVYCTHYHSNSKRYLCNLPKVGADWTEKIWKKNQFIPTIFKTKAEANRYVCGKTNDFETGIEEITIKM
jgi:hypothetical protein